MAIETVGQIPTQILIRTVTGDTLSENVGSFTDLDENGVEFPANLTGSTFRMMVRYAPLGSKILMSLTNDNFILGQSAEALQYDIDESNPVGTTKDQLFVLAQPDLTTILPGEWYFDIEQTDSGGDVKTILNGQFIVLEDVTR